ncbi:hypothetical protein Tco_0338488 [Tanacetum coccineum]
MNLLRLESPLADAPRMSDLQPDGDQLMVPIHRKNIAKHRSALAGVYALLVEPLSVQNLTGVAGTFDVLPTAVATTTALSTTFASAITVYHSG